MTDNIDRLDGSGDGESSNSFLMKLREWGDALVIAFVLAMFIRTFVVELFKIPSGSMSPTLLGDVVAEGVAYDAEGQSGTFLLIGPPPHPQAMGEHKIQVFRKDNENHYRYEGKKWQMELTMSQLQLFQRDYHLEEHRIFVNKFAYWFKPPARGDIVVFRVPLEKKKVPYERNGFVFEKKQYNRNQGVYVKRAVGLGGELVEIDGEGRLVVNGSPVEQPPIFKKLRYNTTEYTPTYSVNVPPNEVIMFGDNTDNSLDSRYWGGVPYRNLRGKAFLRYWPWRKARFLNS